MAELINAVTPQPELVIHTDGGSRGNPGPSAVGVVINAPDGSHLESFGQYIGTGTNNRAEYSAVIAAMMAAEKYHPQKINFFLDSELVVKQLNGIYRVKHGDLQPLFAQIQQMCQPFEVTFQHVLRKDNTLADIEVNKALDAEAQKA